MDSSSWTSWCVGPRCRDSRKSGTTRCHGRSGWQWLDGWRSTWILRSWHVHVVVRLSILLGRPAFFPYSGKAQVTCQGCHLETHYTIKQVEFGLETIKGVVATMTARFWRWAKEHWSTFRSWDQQVHCLFKRSHVHSSIVSFCVMWRVRDAWEWRNGHGIVFVVLNVFVFESAWRCNHGRCYACWR